MSSWKEASSSLSAELKGSPIEPSAGQLLKQYLLTGPLEALLHCQRFRAERGPPVTGFAPLSSQVSTSITEEKTRTTFASELGLILAINKRNY